LKDDNHLLFKTPKDLTSVECLYQASNSHFLGGCGGGTLCLWGSGQRRPVCVKRGAHEGEMWVSAIAGVPMSNLVTTGSGDGFIKFWSFRTREREIVEVGRLEAEGFVNALQFSSTSTPFLVSSSNREPRLGRWYVNKQAQQCISIHKINYHKN